MRFAQIPGVLALAILTACTTTRLPAPSEAIQDISSASKVSVVHYDPEKFMIWTGQQSMRGTALGMFGLIGGAIEGGMQLADAKEAGAKFISASQLTDPITQVENRFLDAWQRELNLRALPTSQLVSSDSPQKLHDQFVMGYVVDFRTEQWGVVPVYSSGLSASPDAYRTSYAARARLIRLHDRKIVWQGTCEYSKDDSLAPQLTTYEITGSDQGVAVKAAMQTLADACADYLWRQFFGRETGPELAPTTLTEMAK